MFLFWLCMKTYQDAKQSSWSPSWTSAMWCAISDWIPISDADYKLTKMKIIILCVFFWHLKKYLCVCVRLSCVFSWASLLMAGPLGRGCFSGGGGRLHYGSIDVFQVWPKLESRTRYQIWITNWALDQDLRARAGSWVFMKNRFD